MSGIYWLASYPKSGNTWVRTLLTNYIGDYTTPADINDLQTDSVASLRELFDEYIGLASAELTLKQIRYYQPYTYEEMLKESKRDLYIKVHDAYTLNADGNPLFPAHVTNGVIYIMRNPLDVIVSYAHHNHVAVEKFFTTICDETHTMATSKKEINNQLPQLLLSWEGHIESWMKSGLNIHIMRYEDMIADPYGEFKNMLEFMGFPVEDTRLRKAVAFSSFDELQQQEKLYGFNEKNIKSESFFRKGKIGSYREKLNREQIETIISCNRKAMLQYGYLDHNNQLIF